MRASDPHMRPTGQGAAAAPSIAIYVNCFMPARTLDREPFVPIQVGAARSAIDLGMITDATGDHISERNGRFCELTGTYWVWKNAKLPDYVGFHHYRRFFDFRPDETRSVDVNGFVTDLRVGERFIERYGLTPEGVARTVDGYDAIVPRPFDVRNHGHASVRDQYAAAAHHHVAHLHMLEAVVAERGEVASRALRDVLGGRLLHANNMFVFSRALFIGYCEWIFPILFELDDRIDVEGLGEQERRAVGYLAERLLSVFLRIKELDSSRLRVRELHRLAVRDTAPLPKAVPRIETDRPIFTVVAASDENYVPHLAALVASVLDHVPPSHAVHFVVLDGGMGAERRRRVDRLERLRADVEITYVAMGELFAPLAAHTYFTRATFYRLVLPDIMPDHDRVVFLDTDLVVVADPTPLLEIDLDGHAMAACRDPVMRSFVALGVRSLDMTGSLPAADYLRHHLGLDPDRTPYRQAGVLVLNLDWLRRTRACERMIEDLARRPYWFLDQDVINRHLAVHAVDLDPRWNVLHMDERHVQALPSAERDAYRAARGDAAIVHYAGLGKPWRNDMDPLGHHYWEYLRRTPFYEETLVAFLDLRYGSGSVARAQRRASHPPSRVRQASRRVWRRLPLPAQRVLKPVVNWFNRNIWRYGTGS